MLFPVIKVEKFEILDVITTSGCPTDGGAGGENELPM